jgi:hypothetical protein
MEAAAKRAKRIEQASREWSDHRTKCGISAGSEGGRRRGPTGLSGPIAQSRDFEHREERAMQLSAVMRSATAVPAATRAAPVDDVPTLLDRDAFPDGPVSIRQGSDAPPADDAHLGKIVPVKVSNEPEERFDALLGFFHRNPGWMKTGGTADELRNALDDVPGVGSFVRELTEPSDVGYGQGIRDQTRWQINTGRQPNNTWWLRMNRQLVEDPLTAERAVRSGTVDQLETKGQKAWAEYIRRADKVYDAMGLSPEQVAQAAKDGKPVALSDAWKGVGLLKRAYVQMVLKPYARKALWIAHRETLADGRPQAKAQAEEMHRTHPEEMSFSSSWATLIGYWSYLSPPITGHQSRIAQKLILPAEEHIDGAKLSWTEKAFTKVADWLDPIYERDIAKPTDAKDALAAAGKVE